MQDPAEKTDSSAIVMELLAFARHPGRCVADVPVRGAKGYRAAVMAGAPSVRGRRAGLNPGWEGTGVHWPQESVMLRGFPGHTVIACR